MMWIDTVLQFLKQKRYASILILQVKSQTTESSQNFIMVLKYILQLRNLMV